MEFFGKPRPALHEEIRMYTIPESFMAPFIVKTCPNCGLEHAPIRTCEETAAWKEAK